jgi:hypothetical protein
VADGSAWRPRLNWSHWNLAADYPRTRPGIIGLRVATLFVALLFGALMLAGFVASVLLTDGRDELFFGIGLAFTALVGGFSFWDLQRLRRMRRPVQDSQMANSAQLSPGPPRRRGEYTSRISVEGHRQRTLALTTLVHSAPEDQSDDVLG